VHHETIAAALAGTGGDLLTVVVRLQKTTVYDDVDWVVLRIYDLSGPSGKKSIIEALGPIETVGSPSPGSFVQVQGQLTKQEGISFVDVSCVQRLFRPVDWPEEDCWWSGEPPWPGVD
jgi:hypothetical protein